MKLTLIDAQSYTIQALTLTPITGAAITILFETQSSPALDPADAFTLGDALQRAARKAGFVPGP